jgi:stearoyl-CoA desaturase (delta-9 desaturase)
MAEQAVQEIRRTGVNWGTTTTVILFHLAAVAALFMFTWQGLLAFVGLTLLAGAPGIGIGYHRLLTHRGFKTPKAVEYFLTVCGMLSLQSGAINWVATHRIHHAHTDGPGDPHTPRDGKWWAHIGWIFTGTAQQHDEAVLRRYAPDLMKDPVHVWLNRLFFVPLIVTGALLLAFGGWSMLFWGVFLRVTVAWHVTWLVNSATHLWGTRRFETGDDSTNHWLIALLTYGEGWHNNHHAHPRSARHGLAWYEFDLNWVIIRGMQLVGLASDIKLTKLNESAAAEREATPNALREAA